MTPGPQTTSQPHHALWWALPLALTGGLLSSVQSRVNGQLATDLGDGFTAAAVSFGGGLVICVVLELVLSGPRANLLSFARDLRSGAFPRWPLLAGVGGALFVLAQSLTVGLVGVSLFIVSVVAGQTVTGLAVDHFGIGPGGRRRLTAGRVTGALIMVAAVALAMSGGLHLDASPFVLVLPLLAGTLISLQQAFNGRVTAHAGHYLTATSGNFVAGTAVLALAALIHVAVAGAPAAFPTSPWLYVGGAIGVVFIAIAALLAPELGVLTLAMTTIAGQIIGSVLLDVAVPAPGTEIHWTTLAGAALTLIAAAVTAGLLRRRPAARPLNAAS